VTQRGAGLLFAAACLCGCGDSMVIRDDDATFARAQERLVRTSRTLETLKAPPEERALFMQAEGFYRYRFARKTRATGSYAAEAAAAITDLPAFQSMAGSLDLLDLRYRTPDNAAQLWETFIAQYPDSKLAPLALYRLGWAYRSVGASGLPRDDPDQAFDALIAREPGSKLAEIARDAKNVPWKSKATARRRSLIPGLGQLYVGEIGSGLLRFGIAAVAIAAFVAPTYVAAEHSSDLSWRDDWALLGTGLLGLTVLSLDYSNSYQASMESVVRWNERAEDEFDRAHPQAP
jgi:hypothetical protein